MHQPTVALIEDDPDFNELLGLYIKNDPDLNLIATGRNGQEAITIANTLRPEVFLMDLNMPVMDGIEATQRILATHPDAKIIAVTTFDSYSYVSQALAAGVHGYLLKNSRAKEIKQAVTAAVEGRAIIDRRALASLVISMNLTQPPQGDPWSELNATEQAITKLVCLGHTNQEIAQELNYSLSNVKNTLSQVYKKMGVTTRTQLLVHAGHHNFPVLD
ncbi:response regulator transcription factor [Rothia sp. SD9660Na]|uniref:response regulator transcription factor n=1 Tax=Rothia sp. SD9660Na TaxID=3047030 RepID=UPI0024B9E618|nr:response regulator transcription factor [Rothia sp. SD9660Na]WHS50574.1 response regulator transcription factor [Rothia sp. SD9660Na]